MLFYGIKRFVYTSVCVCIVLDTNFETMYDCRAELRPIRYRVIVNIVIGIHDVKHLGFWDDISLIINPKSMPQRNYVIESWAHEVFV